MDLEDHNQIALLFKLLSIIYDWSGHKDSEKRRYADAVVSSALQRVFMLTPDFARAYCQAWKAHSAGSWPGASEQGGAE